MGSWIKALKEDKNEIFRAAHDASKATDFLLRLNVIVPSGTKVSAQGRSPSREQGVPLRSLSNKPKIFTETANASKKRYRIPI